MKFFKEQDMEENEYSLYILNICYPYTVNATKK